MGVEQEVEGEGEEEGEEEHIPRQRELPHLRLAQPGAKVAPHLRQEHGRGEGGVIA